MCQDEQLTFNDDPVYRRYQSTFELIRNGEFEKAYGVFEEIIEENFDLPDIFPIMKCLKFWINRKKNFDEAAPGIKAAEYLEYEWNGFEKFISKKDLGKLKFIPYFREAIYANIIDNYIEQFQKINVKDPELLLKLARAFLYNREYNKAKDTLLYAKKFKAKDPRILSLLGDAYFFIDDEDHSRAYFREAFFQNPRKIDVDKLSAPFIIKLVNKVNEHGFVDKEINLWLPIYAAIDNAFYVKRKLSSKEVEKLQKKIYELEIDYEISKTRKGETEPLLLNHYIYLLDDMMLKKIEDKKIRLNNILRKVKNINEGVYYKIRKNYE